MNALLLGLAVAFGAPGSKDAPKKDPGIVGEWIVESLFTKGKAAQTPADGTSFEFTAGGEWVLRRDQLGRKPFTRFFTQNIKVKPATLDIYLEPPADNLELVPNLLGIFKIEGDTLTIVSSTGRSSFVSTARAVPPAGRRRPGLRPCTATRPRS